MKDVESFIENKTSLLLLTRNEVNWDDGRYYKPTIMNILVSFDSNSEYSIYKKIMDEISNHYPEDDPLLYSNMVILDNDGHLNILHKKYNEEYKKQQLMYNEYFF